MIRYVVWPLIALLSFGKVHSQVITTRPGADTMKVVTLINADRLSYKHTDTVTDLQMLAGNVKLRQENTLINCDSAVFNKKTRFVEAFGNVHIIDNDTVHIRSQYLQYYVDTRMAYLKNNVSLTDNKSTLFTNELTYDMNLKIGEYHNGGKLINQTSVLTSKEGTFYEELKDVYFKKEVDLKDPKYTLKTDSLLYNTATQIATFIAPTTIIDSSKRKINTSDGFYDTHNRKAFFGKRPVLNDGPVKIIANSIDSDDSTGKSILRGNAVYIDTAQGISVLANFIEANNKEGTFWATQRPLLILKQDKDSIYITADTLYSGRLSQLAAKAAKDSISRVKDSSSHKGPVKLNAPKLIDTLKVRDSLKLKDSIGVKDSLMVKDSIGVKDSLVVKDSLIVKDSIRVKDSLVAKAPISGKDSVSLQPDTTKRITTDTLTNKPAGKKPVKTAIAANKPANKPISKPASKPTKPVATENKNDSTDRYFQAWHHVRIFSDSMQAVSDSLFYSGKDSIFKLFIDPVMWASNSQITGDTIFLYTKNKNPDKLYVFENGFAVNLSGKDMYNQIKGNRLNGYFNKGEIDYIRATGNGESIYYVKNDKDQLTGINNATSDIIDMRFKNKELNKVVFISEVNGTLYPIKQAKDENKQLRNFKWLEDKRPKTKFELFEDIKKPVIIKDSTDSLQIEPPVVPGNTEQPKVDQQKEQPKPPVEPSKPPADKKELAPFRKKTP